MSNPISIAFCGPIAPTGKPAQGGYQAANKNTISHLQREGQIVLQFPYPRPHGSKVNKITVHASALLSIGLKILFTAPKWQILHITALYREWVYFETVFLFLARLRGRKSVYDLRAGRVIDAYEESSATYRKVFDLAIRFADAVAVEGLTYVDFIAARRGSPPLYFPNFVSDAPEENPSRGKVADVIDLVFVGRIVIEKGIEVVLDTHKKLNAEGILARLTVIGTGDTRYIAALKQRFPDDTIRWLGSISHAEVRAEIRGKHFYLFPTVHSGEGHSNALTECMSEGIVPICSDNGFNKSVVADCGRILPTTATSDDYAREIRRIWDDREWDALSLRNTQHIRERYTADVVMGHLIGLYSELLNGSAGR